MAVFDVNAVEYSGSATTVEQPQLYLNRLW
jgi:hypothetical protein